MAWNLRAIEQVQRRGRRRVDAVGRPKFDFHTGYQVLCDRDRSIALGQAYTAQGTAKRARKLIARGGSL